MDEIDRIDRSYLDKLVRDSSTAIVADLENYDFKNIERICLFGLGMSDMLAISDKMDSYLESMREDNLNEKAQVVLEHLLGNVSIIPIENDFRRKGSYYFNLRLIEEMYSKGKGLTELNL